MLNKCTEEVDDIRNCCDCYFNRDQPKSILLACSKPHLILWVRYGKHPWWPAKLLGIGNGRFPLEVEFFGEFSSAEVTYTDCLLYSPEGPNTVWCNDSKNELFRDATHVSSPHFVVLPLKMFFSSEIAHYRN